VKIGRWILLALVLSGAGFFAWRHYRGSRPSAPVTDTLVPTGIRIKVEVLNATQVKGLARKATMFLRDRGFDVVAIGTANERRSNTLVLDRSGHPDWAALAAKPFNARVESRPDTSRYLDVTVMIGADWRPPPLPFYP
jgi:hypothetical protein